MVAARIWTPGVRWRSRRRGPISAGHLSTAAAPGNPGSRHCPQVSHNCDHTAVLGPFCGWRLLAVNPMRRAVLIHGY